MRRILALALLTALPAVGFSASGSQTLVNEAGLTYNNTYPQNLNSYGLPQIAAAKISAQITYSSVSYSNKTFTDGGQSTGSLTVVSTAPLVAAFSTNTITVPSSALILGAPATGQVTISSGVAGMVLTFNGNQLTEGVQWNRDVNFSSMTAVNLTAAMNLYWNSFLTASTTGYIIYSTADVSGASGNAFTMVSSTAAAMAVSSTNFSGGLDPILQADVITFNGVDYRNDALWTDNSGTSSGTALSISNMLNSFGNVKANAATTLGTPATGYMTITSTTGLSGAIITVAGNSTVNLSQGVHWNIASTSSGTATNVTAAINNVTILTGIIAATTGYTTIYATATVNGTAGNSYTFASTTPTVITTAPFTNGANPSYGSVVYTTATLAGTAGNAITLSASPGLTIGTTNYAGGQDNASITINGITLTLGTDFPVPLVASTTANLASSIATAINANAKLKLIITAQAIGSVVTSTANAGGTTGNYTTVSSTQSKLSFANATMTGGANPGYSITTDLISITGHGFTKALPVLYSGSPAIGGLSTGTTYYVVVVDSNTIGLSSTSVVAQAGNYIDLTSSSTQTTADTYTLAPLTFSQGSAAAKWQVSNDGTNWADFLTTASNVAVSSQTFAAVFPSSTVVQDFGNVDYKWIRYNAVGPTQGGVNLQVILNAKD